jgi:nucleotide-binding universal stress UspA family protein
MGNIVVGVDGSEQSLRAVGLAAQMAAKTGAELILVTASERAPIDGQLEEYARAEHLTLQELRNLLTNPEPACLEQAEAAAKKLGAKVVRPVGVIGEAAEEIVEAARRHHSELIVVGRRGHGHLAYLLFGSVSQKVIQHAPCPVVVIR